MNARNLLKNKSVRIKILLILLVGAIGSGACIRYYVKYNANRTLVRYHEDSFSMKVIRKNMHYYAVRKSNQQTDTLNLGMNCPNISMAWTNNNYVCLDLNNMYDKTKNYILLPKDLNKACQKYTSVIAISDTLNILVELESPKDSKSVSKIKIYNWDTDKTQWVTLGVTFDKNIILVKGKFSLSDHQLLVVIDDYHETFAFDPELFKK